MGDGKGNYSDCALAAGQMQMWSYSQGCGLYGPNWAAELQGFYA